jgi:hypothetical protein
VLVLGNADNGESLCVRPGAAILVLLTGQTGPITAEGPLTPHSEGILSLPGLVAGDSFIAQAPGTAVINSQLSPCSAAPGTMHCMLVIRYQVTINVQAAT